LLGSKISYKYKYGKRFIFQFPLLGSWIWYNHR